VALVSSISSQRSAQQSASAVSSGSGHWQWRSSSASASARPVPVASRRRRAQCVYVYTLGLHEPHKPAPHAHLPNHVGPYDTTYTYTRAYRNRNTARPYGTHPPHTRANPNTQQYPCTQPPRSVKKGWFSRHCSSAAPCGYHHTVRAVDTPPPHSPCGGHSSS